MLCLRISYMNEEASLDSTTFLDEGDFFNCVCFCLQNQFKAFCSFPVGFSGLYHKIFCEPFNYVQKVTHFLKPKNINAALSQLTKTPKECSLSQALEWLKINIQKKLMSSIMKPEHHI